ncbi:AMP-binding protein [Natronorubrum sp. JWXQ-INN-674]|uniref:AMP-binding protein n=1 Tax=Natronorubrum halalkaliphilum TaxID=2691917 RepID=A0A6B0VII6_9EURY|nr:AMP-binding protein [Natronorubrum halalkaliphilum]MXV61378.1 AMP-binding protein [Natronorubrum halalkaliphilum]
MDTSPNLADYEALSEVFEWDHIYTDADWDAPDEVNIAHEVCDRHTADRGTVALFFVGSDGDRERITFWELSQRSNRFANVLEELGLERGDRAFAYMPRVPEQYAAMLGTLKAGCVFGGIDPQYGADRVAYRLENAGARVVVTTPEHRETLAAALEDVPSVDHVIVVSDDGTGIRRTDVSYYEAMDNASLEYETVETAGSDPALLYYTSGTTGSPKGIVHGHRWIVGVAAAKLYAADLLQHGSDIYWGTGDRGWLTAPVNALGVWFWGHSLLAYDGEFDAETWASILDEFPVTVLSSIPTIYRQLRDESEYLADADLSLHRALSTGEPLDPELVEWGEEVLDVPIHETYGQAETGNMIVNVYPSIETRPGSIGKPLPGVEAAIVDPDTGERIGPGETGEIAVRGEYPCFFLGYWEDPAGTAAAFVDGPDGDEWYLTGDLGQRDEEGYFWYQGRADDVIISGGTRIGPRVVEDALADHDRVREAAAVPTSHPELEQAVKGYVVPADGVDGDEDLADELRTDAKASLSDREVPEEIEFRDSLPRATTGAIRRSKLRESSLGGETE